MKIKTIFKNYLHVEEISFEKNNKEIIRERINTHDAVAALVYDTTENKFIFVEQFRPGSNSKLIEIVAGKMDVDNESSDDAIKREIEEEIGYKVDYLKVLIPFFYTSPGYSTEKMIIYYAEVSKQISEGGGVDEDEDINVIKMTVDEVKEKISNREFLDGKTLLSLTINSQLLNINSNRW